MTTLNFSNQLLRFIKHQGSIYSKPKSVSFHNTSVNMAKAKRFVLAKHFVGEPKESDFNLEEEELPALKDGDILVEAEWLSVDPYMRPYTRWVPTGVTMIGGQIAKVIESKNPNIKNGSYIMGYFGWRDKSVVDVTESNNLPMPQKPYVLPDFKGLPISLGLGALGMPGITAYFGLLEVCRPKPGETLVISGAAGAVGSLVGQIAKSKGCRVIGFAGSDEKVKWLKNELNFDAAFNYKTKNIVDALKEAAPNGIDCYFDNVGGEFSSTVINRMNEGGRIAVCGSTSSYNEKKLPSATIIQPAIISKELIMEGFRVNRWNDKWQEGILEMLKLIKEGKIKYRETVTEGFENMPKAFIGMLKGENIGKAVVKAKL